MEIRNLGQSGLRVSTIGLGCNNFGGRIDQEATRAVIHKALDLGITLFDTADTYGERGGSETVMGETPRRRPQAHRAGHQVRHADGRCRREGGRLAPLHHERGRGQPAPAAHRLDRPLPDAPARSAHADRGDAARARRPGTPGQGALHRLLELSRLAGGGGAVDREGAQPERASSPARTSIRWLVRDVVEPQLRPAMLQYGMGLLPFFPLASGLLTGKYRRNAPLPAGTRLANTQRLADRYLTERNWADRREARRLCRGSAATPCWNWRSAGCWRSSRWRA